MIIRYVLGCILPRMIIWYWIVDHFWGITILSWILGLILNTVGQRLAEDAKHKALGSRLNSIGAAILTVWFFFAGIRLIRLLSTLPVASERLSLPLPLQVPLTVLAIALVGMGLFVFRVCAIEGYGLAEIAFALASIWVSVSKVFETPHDSNSWIAIVGAAYLLVRGLDNACKLGTKTTIQSRVGSQTTRLRNLIKVHSSKRQYRGNLC